MSLVAPVVPSLGVNAHLSPTFFLIGRDSIDSFITILPGYKTKDLGLDLPSRPRILANLVDQLALRREG